MKDEYILAIDLGTSGPKVALVSTADGEIIADEIEYTRLDLFPDGGAEQNPADWWRAITDASRRVVERSALTPEQIIGINCTTHWSGTVAVDINGNPLMNSIIWMDSRGAPYVNKVTDGLITVEGYSIFKLLKWLRLTAGIPSRSGKDSIAHVLYIKNHHPEIYQRTHKFLEPKDYLNFILTGVYAASYDSIALHWITDNRNIQNIRYHDGLLKACGLNRNQFPELRRQLDIVGPLLEKPAHELGVRPGLPVIIGTPDLQSAAIGSGAVRDYEGHLYIGTSSWITCHVPFKKTSITSNMATLPSAIPERYFVANEQETSGECMKFLRDKIFYADDELQTEKPADALKRFNQIAARIPAGSEGLIFLPWLYGERTPVEDHHVRGGFYNLALNMHRGHMIRAAFEGVAYNSRWLFQAVEAFIKRPMPHLNIIGGGALSDLWCQIMADVLQRKIRRIKDPIQANARGAGLLGAVALGKMSVPHIADRIQVEREFEPIDANVAVYNEMYREYENIYKKNRAIFARLNRKRFDG